MLLKKLCVILLTLGLIIAVIGCGEDKEVINYKGKIINDNPQHRQYTFEKLNGEMVEGLKTEKQTNQLTINAEITEGKLNIKLINDKEKNIININLENKTKAVSKKIDGFFNKGHYELKYDGENVQEGKVELIFK